MNRAFTLLETLFALAIIGIAVTIVTLSFSKVNSTQGLETSADLAVAVLNEARSKTLSSVNAMQYGVNIQESALTLFQGGAYAAGTATNVVTDLNPLVGIRNVSLSGGGANVVFQRLTGAVSQPGTFEIYLRSDASSYKTITIHSTGAIEAN